MEEGKRKKREKKEEVVNKKKKKQKRRVKGRSFKHLCPLRSVHDFRQRESQRERERDVCVGFE